LENLIGTDERLDDIKRRKQTG